MERRGVGGGSATQAAPRTAAGWVCGLGRGRLSLPSASAALRRRRIAERAAAEPELEAQLELRRFRKKLESVHGELSDYSALVQAFRCGGGREGGVAALAEAG